MAPRRRLVRRAARDAGVGLGVAAAGLVTAVAVSRWTGQPLYTLGPWRRAGRVRQASSSCLRGPLASGAWLASPGQRLASTSWAVPAVVVAAASRGDREDGCLCKFGIIGDVQYADCDDGTDFLGIQPRYFRRTLDVLRGAVRRWVVEERVDFSVQMGDLIDGRNAGVGASVEALETVLREFPSELPRLDLLGNHELYNFERGELAEHGLNLVGEGLPGAAPGAADAARGEACYCHVPADGEGGRWELIVLDAYDVACIGYPEGHPKRVQAELLLAGRNPRALMQGVDWFNGLPEELHRFVPYNGGIGPGQLEWLSSRLAECMEAGRRAIVLTHIPLLEASTTPKTVVWNAEEVLQVLRSADGRCIAGVIAGHDHDAGYAVDPVSGIPHITCLSPLLCPEGSGRTGAATVECYDGWAAIKGHGVFCAESGTRATGHLYDRIELSRVDPRGW